MSAGLYKTIAGILNRNSDRLPAKRFWITELHAPLVRLQVVQHAMIIRLENHLRDTR